MPRWNPDRWRRVGTGDGGDPVYVRAGTAKVRDLSSMTKPELQALAEQQGLAKSGSKAELIERLGE